MAIEACFVFRGGGGGAAAGGDTRAHRVCACVWKASTAHWGQPYTQVVSLRAGKGKEAGR